MQKSAVSQIAAAALKSISDRGKYLLINVFLSSHSKKINVKPYIYTHLIPIMSDDVYIIVGLCCYVLARPQ